MIAIEENVLVSLLLFFCPQFFCLLVEAFCRRSLRPSRIACKMASIHLTARDA